MDYVFRLQVRGFEENTDLKILIRFYLNRSVSACNNYGEKSNREKIAQWMNICRGRIRNEAEITEQKRFFFEKVVLRKNFTTFVIII